VSSEYRIHHVTDSMSDADQTNKSLPPTDKPKHDLTAVSSPVFAWFEVPKLSDWRLLPRHNPRPRRLRSADTRTLLVSRTRTNFCDRAFRAAKPRVWNYLPMDLRQSDLSYSQFQIVAVDVLIWSVGPKCSLNPPLTVL